MSVTKTGAAWYGRNAVRTEAVLYSWILEDVTTSVPKGRIVALYPPESPYKPLNCFNSWHEPQLAPNQAQKCVDSLVKFGIFGSGHLCPVFLLTLFAEEGRAVRRKARIEMAQVLEALVAYRIDSLVALASGNLVFENQGFRVGGFLRLGIEGTLRVGGYLGQLRGKR